MIAVALLLAGVSAFCPDGRPGLDLQPRLAEVVGAGPAHFSKSGGTCPGDAACRQRSYVKIGDVVLTYGAYAGFTCAQFTTPSSQTWGWLDGRRLNPLAPPETPPLSAWAGDWHEFDDHIRLTVRKNSDLRVDGGAYWPGRNPAPGSPGPNLGELGGLAHVEGGVATYRDGDGPQACHVTLKLLAPYLVAEDNARCGGMNVTFTGVYRRETR